MIKSTVRRRPLDRPMRLVSASFVSELVRCRLGIRRGDSGATSTEYAIMVSLIALVIIGAVTMVGRNAINLFAVPSSVFTP